MEYIIEVKGADEKWMLSAANRNQESRDVITDEGLLSEHPLYKECYLADLVYRRVPADPLLRAIHEAQKA